MATQVRVSSRANSVARSVGFDINETFSKINVLQTIDELLNRGYTEEEVANIIRPLKPAYEAILKSLDGY